MSLFKVGVWAGDMNKFWFDKEVEFRIGEFGGWFIDGLKNWF